MAGIPLVNVDGWLVAILDPDPRRIGREQFALHAGTLLLFTTEDRQARFARDMQDYEPKPLGGWKTDFVLKSAVPDSWREAKGQRQHTGIPVEAAAGASPRMYPWGG